MQSYAPLPLDEHPPCPRRPWSPTTSCNYQRDASEPSYEALDVADYAAALGYHGRAFAAEAHSTPLAGVSLDPSTTPQTTPALSNWSSIRSPHTPISAYDSPARSQSHMSRWSPAVQSPLRHSPLSRTSRAPWEPMTTYSRAELNMPGVYEGDSIDVDTAKFPAWSRSWFETDALQTETPHFPSAYNPSRSSQHASYVHKSSARHSSQTHSRPSMLPWTGGEDPSSAQVSPLVRDARMKFLEEEFGKDSGQAEEQQMNDPVGGVDGKGNLVTDGPRKRLSARTSQGLFSFGAVIASLYSAIILKPIESPPPRGSAASYLLYIFSVLTFILTMYMFVFRPCCCSGRRRQTHFTEGPAGMMVLPVQGFSGGVKKGKKGKKQKGSVTEGVQVNLIVDPTSFQRKDEDEGDSGWSGSDSWSRSEARNKRAPRRVGVFEGLRKEEQWRTARTQLKRVFAFDIVMALVWTTEFILILLGNRCPSGKFGGWCDSYNTATALSCFLALAFSFSVYFGIKDLHASRISPRTRK